MQVGRDPKHGEDHPAQDVLYVPQEQRNRKSSEDFYGQRQGRNHSRGIY